MEKFSEFDKTKNSESLKKREIESIQTEEKDFFGKIKESALDVFHFASKENFKKTMRAFALATALLIPVGEKAFAEREEKLVEEPTVTIAQMDKEAVKASEAQESVAEQKELIKEKYNKEIIFGGDYSIEELRELDDALRIVQNLASKKFDDLKLGFIRPEIKALKNAAMTLPNVVSGLDELNKIIDKSDNNFDIVNNLINLYKKDASKKYNHEIIITPNKKNLEAVIANKPEFNLYFASVAYSNNKSNEKSYRDLIVHELCHSVAMNDADTYKDLLSKFDEINKNIVGNRTLREIKEDLHNPELKRPKGCVSSYLVSSRYIGEGKVLSEFENKAKYENGECIAEVMTYIALNLDYANDDPVVQEKIKIVKDFLAESNDNEKKDNEEKETKIKLVESDAENLKNQTKNKAEKVKEQKYKSIGLGLDKDKIGEGFPFPDISDLFDKK